MKKPSADAPDFPSAYVEDCKRLVRELVRWKNEHPGASPEFRWPSPSVMLIGPLSVDAAERSGILGNDDARRCVADLDARTDHKMTLFQLRVALVLAQAGLDSREN